MSFIQHSGRISEPFDVKRLPHTQNAVLASQTFIDAPPSPTPPNSFILPYFKALRPPQSHVP